MKRLKLLIVAASAAAALAVGLGLPAGAHQSASLVEALNGVAGPVS